MGHRTAAAAASIRSILAAQPNISLVAGRERCIEYPPAGVILDHTFNAGACAFEGADQLKRVIIAKYVFFSKQGLSDAQITQNIENEINAEIRKRDKWASRKNILSVVLPAAVGAIGGSIGAGISKIIIDAKIIRRKIEAAKLIQEAKITIKNIDNNVIINEVNSQLQDSTVNVIEDSSVDKVEGLQNLVSKPGITPAIDPTNLVIDAPEINANTSLGGNLVKKEKPKEGGGFLLAAGGSFFLFR